MPPNFVPDVVLDKLIDLVRQNPALFDTSMNGHRDVVRTANTWNNIAAILQWKDKKGVFWKTRWRTLRDTYMRKRRERQSMIKSESGVTSEGKKWKFQEVMQFLDDYTEDQYTDSNLEIDSLHSHGMAPDEQSGLQFDFGCTLEDDSSSKCEQRMEKIKTMTPGSSKHQSPLMKSTSQIRSKNKKDPDITPDVIKKALIDLCAQSRNQRRDNTQEQDEDEAFLEPYYSRIKKLPRNVKGVVQLQIAQLFFNAENRHLPPEPIIPLPPIQPPMQPRETPAQYPMNWHNLHLLDQLVRYRSAVFPNLNDHQCDLDRSETSDALATLMKESP